MKNSTRFKIILILAALIPALAGCSKADSGGAATIVVGTGNDYPPICYLDADGNLAGFERDLLDAIDQLLPQYKFKYEVLEFKNILASLDAGRLDLAAHSFGINEERQQKYLFSDEGYLSDYSYVVVAGSTRDITGFEDLGGKTVSVPPATNWAYAIEDFNRLHPDNPILVQYFEQTPDILIANLVTGVVDATLLAESDVQIANTFYGTDFKTVGDPIGDAEESRYVFQKNSTELRDAIDGALRQLKASGRLEAIKKQAVDDFYANAAR
jgi:L-cystine transport system substrate-binding protein